MAHIPHLYIPSPWEGSRLGVPKSEVHHLKRVMRRSEGSAITYTDGAGTVGSGVVYGDQVERSEEHIAPRPPHLVMAVAPPHSADRARFVVEKLAELGVTRLMWLRTEFGRNRPPRADKASAWARAALQQSRGAYMLEIAGLCEWPSLDGHLVVADQRSDAPAATFLGSGGVTLAVGPEGGFAQHEVPEGTPVLDLGPRVLRTETAAIVGAATALWLMRHRG